MNNLTRRQDLLLLHTNRRG